jgi:hypothetical protein
MLFDVSYVFYRFYVFTFCVFMWYDFYALKHLRKSDVSVWELLRIEQLRFRTSL